MKTDVALLPVAQKRKGTFLLADVVLVQDNDIVPEVSLERLYFRHDGVRVVMLVKNAKVQNEYGVLSVNGREAMVPTFIHEDHVIAVGHSSLVAFTCRERDRPVNPLMA